ncbi:MAG: helix-turn-helix transcriptional regulator [Steroidobacteraceae bacterium]|nr:helix-turn-helix transcriptional regulator [Steroidobacteraceae bacterium]
MNTNSFHAGNLLRDWRAARRLSQLDLALEVGVSLRHLSYLENGKSQPSRDMVVRLAEALAMPLRERNSLLAAAGFAPLYRESRLSDPLMKPVSRAIEFILEHQNPYPAFALNRHWDVVMLNRAAVSVFGRLREGGPKHSNVLRQVFDPDDMRPMIANWDEIASELIRHLHDEIAAVPSDATARALLEEVLAFPGVPVEWRTRELGATPLPLCATVFAKGDLHLSFFSTLTTFGTPRDVTLDELRIECMFPADDITAQRCREFANEL